MIDNSRLQSEEQLKLFFEQLPIAMAFIRLPPDVVDYTFGFVNESYAQLMNRKKEQLQGKTIEEAFPELDNSHVRQLLDKVANSKESFHGNEYPFLMKRCGKEEVAYFNFIYKLVLDENGGFKGITIVAHEVSANVLARRKIEYAEERLRLAIEGGGIGTFDLDLQNDQIICGGRFYEILGMNAAEFSRKRLRDFLRSDEQTLWNQAFRRARRTGRLNFEFRFMRPDKNEIWLRAQGQLYFNQHGKPERVLGTIVDITSQKVVGVELERMVVERAAELKKINSELLEAQALAKIGSWDWLVKENRLTWSEGLYKLYELEPGTEMNFERFLEQVHPEDREMVEGYISKAMADKAFPDFFHRVLTPGGKLKYVHARGEIQLDESGAVWKIVGTGQDVTELKAVEESLIHKTVELENTNTELQKFAYIASHDLQEPLRKIRVFSELMRQNLHDRVAADEHLRKINASAERMSLLINDVLNYSRLSAPGEQLAPVDLNQVLEAVLTDFELLVKEKSANIISDTLPVVQGYSIQLQQLFSNLISNALKFTDVNPEVQIRCTLPDKRGAGEDETGFAEIRVIDNGIGFDPQFSQQIFNIFQRLNTRSKFAGTGIGLALCKKIVENHGGTISADSSPGKGATFSILLPV